MNLYDRISKFYTECPNEWNYYNEFLGRSFDDFGAEDFISRYFIYGGKGMVILPFINEVNGMRLKHTVSAFFLGLLIKQKLCPELEIRSDRYEDYKFSYLWFLVCLFHDMGYLQEDDWTYKYEYGRNTREYLQEYRPINGDKHQRFIYEDLGLLYVAPSIYKPHFSAIRKQENVTERSDICFNNGIKVNRAMYRRETILRYLEYCKMDEEIRHYDHGIVGGLWLYDCLMKNYYMQYQKEKQRNHDIVIEDFMLDGQLHFSDEQWNIFAYLADCVITHNMWPANEYTNEKYKKCGLDELTRERFRRITFGDNPILFILALADTIEPIKTYSDCISDARVIWSGIDIEFMEDGLKIKIQDERLTFEKLAKKVIGLDNWLAVNVCIDTEEKEIEIRYYL